MAAYLDRLSATIFHDATPKGLPSLLLQDHELSGGSYDQLHRSGLTADYVARETRRAVAGVAGQTKIYPDIDIDVPTKRTDKSTSADDVRQSVRAAFEPALTE